MKMNKMFAGLIALVAGLALSAGSALAQVNGYVGGDMAMIKLVPYFETGDSKATIIGVQNMSSQEASTMALHAAVTTARNAVNAIDATDATMAEELAVAQQTLQTAMDATYTEHMFVDVNVYDAMGMMMGSASLCLAENQFGYVILQGPAMQDWQEDAGHRSAILSSMEGDIPAYGWAKVIAEDMKYTSCDPEGRTGLTGVLQAGHGDTDVTNDVYTGTNSRVAAWTIIQDVGDGFFGTEVPVSSIMLAQNAGADGTLGGTSTDDGDMEPACYTTPTSNEANTAQMTEGPFVMANCGLIPERAVRGDAGALAAPTTVNAMITARYDAGDESMVYLWLAAGQDRDDTLPSGRRMVDVTVTCEDGSMMMASDIDGNMGPAKVGAPGKLTMIDPTMGAVGELTDMCEGDRGVLNIRMPNGSRVGAAFSHITQMMGHYRMNFPAYSMAGTQTCDAAATAATTAARAADSTAAAITATDICG